MSRFHGFSPFLVKKGAAEVGAVNLGVAIDAGLRRADIRVLLSVALDADAPYIPMGEEEAVGRAVGIMADGAPFELHGRMLKNPGPPFFGMAFETDIDVEFIPAPETRPSAGAMRGVAVRAAHRSFQHLVVGRKMELEPDLSMAGKAKIGFFGLEEFWKRGSSVHPVTIVAGHIAQLVGASLELEEFLLLLVALEAGV
jgi:hypothetical protein